MNKSLFIGYKGKIEAYIYIWFSKSTGLVYVGQTNNIHGVLGRGAQHVTAEYGTLYNKALERGYDINQIDDFMLLSYPLPRERRFTCDETSYRISVEYLVQKKLWEKNIKTNRHYIIISEVALGQYINILKIRKIAEEIAEDFIEVYNMF